MRVRMGGFGGEADFAKEAPSAEDGGENRVWMLKQTPVRRAAAALRSAVDE
jgi:hypothetical protein